MTSCVIHRNHLKSYHTILQIKNKYVRTSKGLVGLMSVELLTIELLSGYCLIFIYLFYLFDTLFAVD